MWWTTTVTKIAPFELSKREWRFWLRDGVILELDSDTVFERPTKRHKFVVVDHWSRLDTRDSTLPRIEPSDAVKEEAKQNLINAIRFA